MFSLINIKKIAAIDIIKKLRRYLEEKYDCFAENLRLSFLIGMLEKGKKHFLNSPFTEFDIVGDAPVGMSFIFSIKKGILLYIDGRLHCLLEGFESYGITYDKDSTFYVFLKTGMHGHIARFKIRLCKLVDYQIVIWGLSRGVHQIDIHGNSLYIVDTYNNRILQIDNYNEVVNTYWKLVSKEYYPNGKLRDGRKSNNYNHFNSIFFHKKDIYLIAHNETYKTSRKSELYVVDDNFNVLDIYELSGSNCHNFYKNSNEQIFCSSLEGAVVKNNSYLLQDGGFTRGLAVSEDGYLVGGSPVQINRLDRSKGDAVINYIDRKSTKARFNLIVKNTQIQEIRRLDCIDYSMNNFGKPVGA